MTDLVLVALLVVIVIALFLLAVIEASMLHVRRSAIAVAAAEGDPRARHLLTLLDDLPAVMNAVLLAVLLAQVTAAGIAGVLARHWFGGIGVALATVAVTVVLFVYGEAIPKTIAIHDPAGHARRLATPIRVLREVMRPVVFVLVRLADWQSPGLVSVNTVTTVSEGELLHLAGEAAAAGQIEESDAELIERSFTLGDLRVEQILIPIERVVAVSTETSVADALRVAIGAGHRRLVVHDVGGHYVGFVRLRDLAGDSGTPDKRFVADHVREALSVDATWRVFDVLRRMQAARLHLAVVTNGNGTPVGIVTIEDIVEELLGRIDEP